MPHLYPKIEPFKTERIQVSDLHEIYMEQVGNPKGQPVIFLHGGPGGGLHPDYRRYFDPDYYRVILFDQRGSGQSTPHAELKENTTWDLVADIEVIRKHLDIDKWIVFGGSWGSTLSLSYAVEHPDRVENLVLRGIFMCRPKEIQWFYQKGTSFMFPDLWQKYEEIIEPAKRTNMVKAYYELLTHQSSEVRLEAAKRWSQWEAGTSHLYYDQDAVDDYGDPHKALAFARIECHYFMNDAFFPYDNFLLAQAEKFKHIKGWIVQGRYDVVCPPTSAWELHQVWPNSELVMIPDAGHSMSEPGIQKKLVEIMDGLRKSEAL
ncbi:MAG: prolyl aminopeptidase [Bdellovibrionaceae bacterium]|nr:prolyl aminopeptidase [Pseudobdellovibrionaceae bacterium]